MKYQIKQFVAGWKPGDVVAAEDFPAGGGIDRLISIGAIAPADGSADSSELSALRAKVLAIEAEYKSELAEKDATIAELESRLKSFTKKS